MLAGSGIAKGEGGELHHHHILVIRTPIKNDVRI